MSKKCGVICLTGILLLASLLLLIVFLQHSPEKVKENISEKIDIPAEVKNLNTLKNTNPNFKIGKIYEYKIIFPSMNEPNDIMISDKYYIKGIERFNKSDCFIILKNLTTYQQNQLIEKEENTACIGEDGTALYFSEKYTLYFSEKDKQSDIGHWNNTYYGENASKFLELSSLLGKFIYGKWMLNLNDGYKDTFTINFTRNKKEITFKKGDPEIKGIPVDEEYKISVKVDGREKLHNKECFKVKVKITIKSEDKIDEEHFRNILWIDVEDRVLIKALIYVGIPPIIFAEIEPLKIEW